jgi:hypothetical protein
MADKIIPDDLRNKPSDQKTNDYFLVTVNDLNPAENYNFQFRWVYEDSTTSEWSSTFSTFTVAEGTPNTPRFTSGDLVGGNGFVKLTWTGLNSLGTPMSGLKQVNIWIKGGTYGNEFVNSGQFFTAPGTKTITLPIGEYFFKLQAETVLGSLSLYSAIQSVRSFKRPPAVSGISGTWVKDDGITKTDTLKVSFTYDTTFSDSTFSALNADYFLIRLTNTSNGESPPPFIAAINKASSIQTWPFSSSQNKASFGLFASQFTISITVVDSFGNYSDVVSQTSLVYGSPLDTPIITLTKGILSYSVYWNSQDGKPLDQIYIEEVQSNSLTDPSTGYEQVAQGIQNPIIVQTLNTNKRWVRAKFYDSNGIPTNYSIAHHVTPDAAVTADTEGPPNVASVTSSGGLDTSGTIGFNGFANVSWASVTTGGIRGYRIRYKATTSLSYSYADSPGTGTSYRLTGLGAGLTYEIAVATYDEFNNTSSNYVSGSNVVVGGKPYIADTVDVTGYFSAKANANDLESTAFKFGYGVDTGKRGIVLTPNNYWYIDSNQSASLKVGGSTTNFIEWNGSSFIIDGDLRAKKGSFSGNINMASGASIYSGTIGNNTVTATGDTGGSLVSAGYIINSGGITFSNGLTGDALRQTTIEASTGLFTTNSANIGGWDVNKTTISKNGITLNSSGTIIANKNAYYVGIKAQVSSADDIVLWAGQSATGGSVESGANFRVTAGGNLYATGAAISGALVIESGTTFDEIALAILTADTAAQVAADASTLAGDALPKTDFSAAEVIKKVNSTKGSSVSTYIIGGAIATGTLISTGYSGPATVGSYFSTNGTAFSLDNGAISSKKFYITSSGDAFFQGTITGTTIDATNTISAGIEIIGPVIKTSTTAATNGVVIDSTGIFGYNSGVELFKLTAGTLTTQSAVIGPLTIANGAITSTQFSIAANGNATFRGAVEGGTLTTTPVNGDKVIIKENDIQFYSNGATYGSLKISDNSLTLSVGLGEGRVSFTKDGDTNLWSGAQGRVSLNSANSIMTSPNQSNGIRVLNTYAKVDMASSDAIPSLRNISFTQTSTQPSGGNIGDVVLVFA